MCKETAELFGVLLVVAVILWLKKPVRLYPINFQILEKFIVMKGNARNPWVWKADHAEMAPTPQKN
jgi:hypothetical protein